MSTILRHWKALQELEEKLRREPGPFLFRGQACDLPLSTSFERQAVRFGIPPDDRTTRERHLIREFTRHYHRFAQDIPADGDLDRWLSLMQHHGAPTRALDFTYSFWVAVFFAVERLKPAEHGSLWWFAWRSAFDVAKKSIPSTVEALTRDPQLGRVPGLVTDVLRLDLDLVLTFSPHELDERFAIQQGAHLIPLTMRKPIAELLAASDYRGILGHATLCFERGDLIEVLSRLHAMNIERRVLFPDLDGLAEGLTHRMALPDVFPPAADPAT